MPYTHLKDEYDLALYFHNPNIHPQEEFEKRLNTFIDFAKAENAFYVADKDYLGMESWTKDMPTLEFPHRCQYCYIPRLRQSAIKAKELNCEVFTTTLLYSRYQQHDLIIAKGHEIAEEFGLEFLDRDFRPYWYEGIQLSKEMKLYRQKYCGCGLSEKAIKAN